MCPNDDAVMQTVDRSGVQFDMCPICRSVWLDRGELEKLIDARDDAEPGTSRPEPVYHDDDNRDRYRRYDGKYPYRKKRGFDLFDIFD
jgi:Zn-finger nucleic acid-binding protein